MNKSIFELTVHALTDNEIATRYNTESPDAAKHNYEQARRDYDKWLETITDYKAHEAAFDVVENIARTAQICAYSEGFKAGIKLITEALS